MYVNTVLVNGIRLKMFMGFFMAANAWESVLASAFLVTGTVVIYNIPERFRACSYRLFSSVVSVLLL